ncbi:hypothetical protein ACFVIM_25500 [Streptomyces sp. NPDC057638]|uniref:hypothetical protein n=1 Tax=Streptomyces sp. NPDC057638 TaxID=3346190 RepID=UPI0036941A9F
MSDTASPLRRRRRARLTAAFAALLALIGYVAVRYSSGGDPARCVVRAASGEGGPRYELSTEMAANAATISAVGTSRGLPERAVTIALATALQESSLRNIDHGDRDSLGLFQQRPSKGWGTPDQILDPVYSAGKFYDGLTEVPGYSRLPLTVAAQKVQRSGFPQAYAKHEPNATLLAAALTGRAGSALSCTPGATAATGEAATVRTALTRDFGAAVLAGAPRTGAREIAVAVPSATSDAPSAGPGVSRAPTPRRGWELAHWAVARAERLGIAEVSYGGKVWSAEHADRGWRPSTTPPAPGVRLRLAP